ncbi:MAG TPA: thioesterase family protein [Syntrophorhabdaceae bacterium]|jgi:acyl-CoA thioesterase FadM
MTRIRLVEQKAYEFQHPLTLEPRDINYGGHLGHDSLISLLGAARVHMLSRLGLTELDLGDTRSGLIMSDLVVNYRAEAFMLDRLIIAIHADEFTRTAFRLFYRVSKEQTLIALAETGMVTFDYRSRKAVPVPRALMEGLTSKELPVSTPPG